MFSLKGVSVSTKVSWKKIYEDFCQRHPNLKKQVVSYKPFEFCAISIQMKDGSIITYDYSKKMCVELFLK